MFAQRALLAAMIRAIPAALIFHFLRAGLATGAALAAGAG
jgi:hypothetical protein